MFIQPHRRGFYRLAGGTAHQVQPWSLGSIVIGIVGSALGHHLSDSIGLSAYGPVARLAVSVGGAVLLITILRFVGIM